MSSETMTPGRAAAEWWAEQLGAPVYRMTDDTSSGQERRDAGFASMMAGLLAARHPVQDGQGATFVKALAPVIDKLLKRTNWAGLSVDYGPDLTLAKAAQAADIDLSRFPWKTDMSVTKDYVTASLGYRAPDRLIWQSPTWKRPACGSMGYDEQTQRFAEKLCGLPKFHDDEHGNWQPNPHRCTDCGESQAKHWNDRSIKHTFQRATDKAPGGNH